MIAWYWLIPMLFVAFLAGFLVAGICAVGRRAEVHEITDGALIPFRKAVR